MATETKPCVTGLDSLQGSSENSECEAAKMKPKFLWRPWDVRDARITGCLPKKAAYTEWKNAK